MYTLDDIHINDAGPAEDSHYIIKMIYRRTSKRQETAVQESVRRFNTERNPSVSSGGDKGHKLMNGFSIANKKIRKKGAERGDTTCLKELITSKEEEHCPYLPEI